MDLATAMAISAAAAAPNMGANTSRAMVALLTLLNVRLGYWVPNPGLLEEKLSGSRVEEDQRRAESDWKEGARTRLPGGLRTEELAEMREALAEPVYPDFSEFASSANFR